MRGGLTPGSNNNSGNNSNNSPPVHRHNKGGSRISTSPDCPTDATRRSQPSARHQLVLPPASLHGSESDGEPIRMADLYGSSLRYYATLRVYESIHLPGKPGIQVGTFYRTPQASEEVLQFSVTTCYQLCFWQAGFKTQRLIPAVCSSLVTSSPTLALPNQMCLRSATIASDKSGRTRTGCQCRLSNAPTRSARGCVTRTTPTYGGTGTRGTSTGSAANMALHRQRRMYRQHIPRQPTPRQPIPR